MAVQERDPCPHRIFDDIGGAFAMGAIGGGVWNSVKGARNSPRGERLLGSVTAVKARAPVMGGALGDSLYSTNLKADFHRSDRPPPLSGRELCSLGRVVLVI